MAAPVHALAMHGTPKYGPGFAHFDYVNPDAPKGGALRAHRIGTFDSFNPFVIKGKPAAGLSILGAGLVYEPLMIGSYDEPFTMYCLVCESVDLAADRLSVTFALRPGARFSDGRPVTADDVVWSFETLMGSGQPFYRAYWGDVVGVQARGETVTFRFKHADNAELPLIIGQLPVLPRHAYVPGNTLEKPIGSGPYRISDFDPGRSVTYEKDPNWWGADLPANRGRYNFSMISYDYYRDPHVALEAFLAGSYDWRMEERAQAWAESYDTPAVRSGQITKAEIAHRRPQGMSGFIFNTRRPVFQDIATRRALAAAFDFERANAMLAHGTYTRSHSFFTNSELADPDGPQAPEADLRGAARALTAQGWAPGAGGVRERDGQRLEFEVLLNGPGLERWALAYSRDLAKIGVAARIRIADSAQYQERLNRFNYDMILGAIPQSSSPGNEQRDYWSSERAHAPGGRNYAGVRDPEVDALVEALIRAESREALVARTRALDRRLREGAYVVPGWHLPHWRLAWWAERIERPARLSPLTPAVEDTWWAKPPATPSAR